MNANSEGLSERLVLLFRALGDATRLRLLGLIAEHAHTGSELAAAVAVGAPTVSHHLDKLVRAGLVKVERHGQSRIYSLDQEMLLALAQLARGTVDRPGQLLGGDEVANAGEQERAKVLRDFFEGERLKQIPAQRKKRVVVLQYLLERFDPDRDYTEREVSESLKEVHPDFATLRRELVDYGYMTRAGGVYRVARELPARSVQVNQEITGNELDWLRRLLASTVR